MKNDILEMDENKICIGIDLGTTNTTAAIMAPGQADPRDLPIMQKGHGTSRTATILPSILYRKIDGSEVVGNEAEDLKKSSISGSQDEIRYLENTKRYMGTKQTFSIGDKTYSPIDVATAILAHVKKYSEINKNRGDYYTIITVPAKFRTDQRNATLEAAKKAGFKNVELYDEPKAAILSFLHEDSRRFDDKLLDLSTPKRILVIDIGGGTCDISVEDVKQDGDKYVFAHMAVGREDLGGVDFDTRIGDELSKGKLTGVQLNAADIAALRSAGQELKERISDDIYYFICEEYDGDEAELYKTANWLDILEKEDFSRQSSSIYIGNDQITFTLDVRGLFNSISTLIYQTSDEVAVNKDEREKNKNMESLVNATLSDYGISLDSIDMIFLTGGMAKCFLLRAALYEIFQKPIISPSDPFYAVSRGASLVNRYKSIDESSSDLMPNAVMMDMDDGRLETLVEMGEQVPVTKTVDREFTAGATGVVIRLFEGKNEFDSQLRRINNLYVIKFDEPAPNRKFKIAYTVDRTKRIKFTITFLDNNEEYEIDGQIKEGNE